MPRRLVGEAAGAPLCRSKWNAPYPAAARPTVAMSMHPATRRASPAGHRRRGARARDLVDAEVVGDAVYACEPKYKQYGGERADERERN